LNLYAFQATHELKQRYDIVHVYNCQQIPAAVLYAKRTGAKVVATLNNMVPVCTNPSLFDEEECANCSPYDSLDCAMRRRGSAAMKAFMPVHWTQFQGLRRYAKKVDAFIALSEETKRYYVNSGFEADRIRVIPNMFDPKLLGAANAPRVTQSRDHRNIMYAGRLEIEKGLQLLIEAMSIMDRSDTKLYLVGKGEYEGELKDLAMRLGISDRVVFTGFIPPEETAKYYSMADVFVHPAIWPEPFARTILESLAFDVPLIVSDKGPSSKILQSACLSFKTGDANDLAEKLETVLSDKVKAMEMRSHGRVVLSRYAPETVLSKVEDLYGEVLGR
ncbi:MAG: glycosyltransferase family 4 protein, partial [Methanomassiliicoccales archaeon]